MMNSPIPFSILPMRGSHFPQDTPDWELTSNFRSELCFNLQVPHETAMLSLATAISTVIQTMVDVERPNGLIGPISLYTCIQAGASERKSSVDNINNKPTRLCEIRQRAKVAEIDRVNKVKKQVINAKKNGYLKAIQNSVVSSPEKENTNADLGEFMEHMIIQRLELLDQSQPRDKKPMTFIMENTTLEALLDHLKDERCSKGIISPEGLNVFTGRFMQGQSYLNSIFSGDPVTVHRKSGDCYTINDARVSIGIMVQPEPFKALVSDKRRGKDIRASGFASRFLFACPKPMAGTRYDNTGQLTWTYRDRYNARMGELLSEALQYYRKPDQPRKVLKFSREAAKYWLSIYNAIEVEMGPMGRFARCSDHGGKLPEIIARVAAVFHYFEGNKGDISVASLEYALRICMYCSDCYLDIFDQPPEELTDANELNEWFNTHVRSRHERFVSKNFVRQYGPGKLREKNRLNQALFTLENNNCLKLLMYGKTHFIDLFPQQGCSEQTLQFLLGRPK